MERKQSDFERMPTWGKAMVIVLGIVGIILIVHAASM